MKTKLLFSALLIVLFVPQIMRAQVFSIFNTNYGGTVSAMRGIGIGDFAGFGQTSTSSRLHVSNFFCNNPSGVLNGKLFRTDGLNNIVNKWQMFTGASAGNLTEKGMIFNYGNNPIVATDQNNFSIQATAKDLTFHTGALDANGVAVERMRILGGNGSTAGNVGINIKNPASLLHINDGGYGTFLQFTNTLTGTLGSNGFRIGLINKYAIIMQQEAKPLYIYVNGAIRQTILETGLVGINTTTPATRLEVLDVALTPQFRITQTQGTVFTDFQTTSLGDLYINPISGGINPRNVGIGTSTPIGRLTVENLSTPTTDAIFCFNAGSSSYNTAIHAEASSDITNAQNFGVTAIAAGNGNQNNYGVKAQANGSAIIDDIGVLGIGNGANINNFGGKFEAYPGPLSIMNFGMMAYVPTTNSTDWAGWFEGNVNIDGSLLYNQSDIKLKDSINPYKNALIKIRALMPKTFVYKASEFPSINFPNGKQYGLIAQEIEPVFPELVVNIIHPAQYDSIGNIIHDTIHTKSINYNAFIPILIQGEKELDSAITILTSPPVAPQLISPQNGETLGDSLRPIILLKWNTSKGAVSYYVEASRSSSFSNIVYSYTLTDTVYYAPNAGDTSTIYWHVQAINGNGKSPFSVTRYYYNLPQKIKPKDASSQQYATLSDSTLKTNVSALTNAMSLITQMQPVKFYWDTINHTWLPASAQVGMIAQQMNNIVPQVVFKDTAGYYNIQYGRLVPVLVEGIKELNQHNTQKDSVINSLNDRLTTLEGIVTQCCQQTGNNAKTTNNNTINVELANDAVLYQNIPNPFGEETMINYYIPENNSNAKIIFFDMYGQSMKEVPLTETGSGNIHVDSKNLASGIYSYSLIINGKVIDTKKMVRNK